MSIRKEVALATAYYFLWSEKWIIHWSYLLHRNL